MAHTIIPTKHPHIAHIKMSGDLTYEDMTCDTELGLGQGKPIFVICNLQRMNLNLPDTFVEHARMSFIINPDLQHVAVITTSKLMRSVALTAAALSARRAKISVHDSEADAEACLMGMIRQKGL